MPDCNYCEERFDSEDEYLTHLREQLTDELGPIDRRKVGSSENDSDGRGSREAPFALGLVGVLVIAAVVYIVFFAGSGGSSGPGETAGRAPTALGSVHYHQYLAKRSVSA